MTTGSRVGPRELSRLRPAMGFGDQSAYVRCNRNEERSNLRLGYHEPRPREKRKDRRANNSFKPTPFRCVACVRSLRSHASPHRSRSGLTQALALRNSWSCWRSSVTSGSRVGPRELSRLRLTSGFGDQSAHFRGNRSEEQVVGPSTTCSPQMQSTKITALTTRSSRRRFVASPVCVRYARTRRRTAHGAA